MHIIERKDIVRRLSIEVQKAGGQTAWANKNGPNRTDLNKVLHGVKPPSGLPHESTGASPDGEAGESSRLSPSANSTGAAIIGSLPGPCDPATQIT
jgi:hypothetical protein